MFSSFSTFDSVGKEEPIALTTTAPCPPSATFLGLPPELIRSIFQWLLPDIHFGIEEKDLGEYKNRLVTLARCRLTCRYLNEFAVASLFRRIVLQNVTELSAVMSSLALRPENAKHIRSFFLIGTLEVDLDPQMSISFEDLEQSLSVEALDAIQNEFLAEGTVMGDNLQRIDFANLMASLLRKKHNNPASFNENNNFRKVASFPWKSCTNLRCIFIRNLFYFDDDIFMDILNAASRKLESVVMHGCAVTDTGIDYLADRCQELEDFVVVGYKANAITEASITKLCSNAPKLRKLVLHNVGLQDETLLHIAKAVKRLEIFIVVAGDSAAITDDGVSAFLANLSNKLSWFQLLNCRNLTSRTLENVVRHCAGTLSDFGVTMGNHLKIEDFYTFVQSMTKLNWLTLDEIMLEGVDEIRALIRLLCFADKLKDVDYCGFSSISGVNEGLTARIKNRFPNREFGHLGVYFEQMPGEEPLEVPRTFDDVFPEGSELSISM